MHLLESNSRTHVLDDVFAMLRQHIIGIDIELLGQRDDVVACRDLLLKDLQLFYRAERYSRACELNRYLRRLGQDLGTGTVHRRDEICCRHAGN
ncbi:hypothetical protein [Pararhizobium sp. PWRC1-1]|uniref:hypothetical protein n=1 Tax=Pararhizobium sp. PWRC1-1 TaxID=2804566 RepID=UPI003CE9419A